MLRSFWISKTLRTGAGEETKKNGYERTGRPQIIAKTWKQIITEMGKVPPEQTRRDQQGMLKEKGMTWAEFTATEEWKEMAVRGMHARFNNPGVRLDTSPSPTSQDASVESKKPYTGSKDKHSKLRPPTDEELKELFRGIIQENHDHPLKPRRVKCSDCRHRIPGTVTCKLYPQIIPKQILDEQEKCPEFKWKYAYWYEILVEDEFVDFFADPNMQLYVSADKKVPHYLLGKFREIVHGMTTACSFGESGRAIFEKSADRNPIMVRAFNHYLKTCPDGQNRFTNIWRTMEDHYELDPETLSAEQIAVLILYPFWSRMGGSFEEEFAEDGRLGKYLLALQKKVKAMADHPNSITSMSYLEAHKIFNDYIDVIANNENRENVPFYRKSAFKHSKEQITYAYKVFMAVAYRYGNNIYTQEEINGYNTVFGFLWMPWVDDAFADEYIKCQKILNDTSLWGRFKNRTAIPYVKEKLDRLTEELFTKYKEVDVIEFMKEKDAFTNSIHELVNKSIARAKEIPQDPQRKKIWLNRYVEDYCWNAYRIIGLTVRQEDVNCFWPMPTLYQFATHPETGNRFTEEQRKYISENRTG